ncbi:MAG TPA: histidinol-phosphate aminotransferase, partial [Methanocorpusculum sp.]|nr:histidinol-phosphate aminotransferase [Methanocorpusculum sp.]
MKQQVRSEFAASGYVFAKSPEAIAKEYGFSKIALLGSNENPYPPSETVRKAAAEALSGVNRYPDPKA